MGASLKGGADEGFKHDTSHEGHFVPRRRVAEEREAVVRYIVMAQNVKEVLLPLV